VPSAGTTLEWEHTLYEIRRKGGGDVGDRRQDFCEHCTQFGGEANAVKRGCFHSIRSLTGLLRTGRFFFVASLFVGVGACCFHLTGEVGVSVF